MKNKVIVHLSSAHSTSDTRIFYKECRSLAMAGFDVRLIAKGECESEVDGVQIRPIPPRPGGRLVRMTRSATDVLRLAIQERGDAYHFHDPELIPVGLILKLRGKQVIYDVHEHYGKLIRSKYWIPKPLRTIVASVTNMLERIVSRLFDGVIVATPAIGQVFPASKLVVVQNFALVSEFSTIDTSDYEDRDRSVTYIGSITKDRGIEELVRAMAVSGELAGTHLVLGGTFAPPSLESEMEEQPGYDHVDYRGWLDRNAVRNTLSLSRAGILVLRPEPNYLDSYPVKLFEYMAAGIPVVASNFPFWEQFITDIGSGLMVDPLSPDDIAKAIRWIIEHPEEAEAMGQRGRKAVLEHYSWESEAAKLVDFYRERIFG